MLVGIVLAVPVGAHASSGGSMVVATEEPTGGEATTEAPAFEPGQEPAVIAPPASEEAVEPPWTSRFLAPTLLVIGLIALVGSIAYYGVRVRSRYEVVD